MENAWNTAFITPDADMLCPTLFRAFAAADMVAARLDITGLGLYRAFVNGERVGDDYLTPGFNDYDAYLRYQSYDVSALLQEENLLEVTLGDGWYMGRFGMQDRRHIFGSRYLLSARLVMTHADGHETVIETDDSWQAVKSPILENSIYDGEARDDTTPRGTPVACRVVETAYRPEPQFSPPIRIKAVLKPELLHSPAGETILDFGQNMAGVLRFRSRLPRGAEIRLSYGEILKDGCFCRDNLRSARAEYRYVSDGEQKLVEPYFTYYGFRYVKVECAERVGPADFTALALSSDLRETLSVQTDRPMLDRLLLNVLWSQRGNFLDLPTDCPQRDERLGWTSDTQVFVNTACYQMDCKAFYRKFMRDMRADQVLYLDGNIPMYSPCLKGEGGPGGAVWADAATIIPWLLYRHYGDRALLQENYPMMRDYVETVIREDEARGGTRLINYGFCFGDWLALDGGSEQSMKGGTEDAFIQTVYYRHSLRLCALAARELDRLPDAERYERLAAEVFEALLREYVTPNGRLAVDTQTAYVLALRYGIWRECGKLEEGFAARLKKDGYMLRTGFAGTPLLLPVLFDHGMADAAYRMLFREEYPGWLYTVKLGATTVWERWNSVLPDGRLSGTGMNSLNHYAYGSVAEAVYSRVAGLRCGEPGWKSALIVPQPNWRMRHIALSFDSPAGLYRVEWQILDDGRLRLEADVPAGASARLLPPDHPDGAERRLEAGEHSLLYRPTVDYLHPFSVDAPVCDLLENEEARTILAETMPALYDFLGQPDNALKAESIAGLCATLPFADEKDAARADVLLRGVRV